MARGNAGFNAGRSVVRAVMRKRVNAGALVTAGRTKAAFKATAGRSVCVSTVSFGLHRRGFVYSGNWEGKTSAVLSGAICSTGAASSALTGEIDSAGAFAGAR